MACLMVSSLKPVSQMNLMASPDEEVYEEEEILEDLEEEEYYEEEVITDDGEDYIEEVIEEPVMVKATPNNVDRLSLAGAKAHLMSLFGKKPKAADQESLLYGNLSDGDDSYSYEEYELTDAITPIRTSQRLSLFDAPNLDLIEEGEDENSARSSSSRTANSLSLKSPTDSKHRGKSQHGVPSMPTLDEEEANSSHKPSKSQTTAEPSTERRSMEDESSTHSGPLNDAPRPASSKSQSGSTKSLQTGSTKSMGTEATDSMASFSSLDYYSSSPHSLKTPVKIRKNRHRPSSGGDLVSPKLTRRSEGSDHSNPSTPKSRSGRRESSDHSSTPRSLKNESSNSRRTGSSKSSPRTPNAESELLGMLTSPKTRKTISQSSPMKKNFSSKGSGGSGLGDMLGALPNSEPKRKDAKSAKSSGSRRSSTRNSSSKSGRSSSSCSSKPKPSLDQLLAQMPSEPRKRSDARSTVSAAVRSNKTSSLGSLLANIPQESHVRRDARSTVSASMGLARGRRAHRDDRDCQSVVQSNRKPKRSHSVRKPKVRGERAQEQSLRSRSSSIGRKQRLRKHRYEDQVRDKPSLKGKRPSHHDDDRSVISSARSTRRETSTRSRSRDRDAAYKIAVAAAVAAAQDNDITVANKVFKENFHDSGDERSVTSSLRRESKSRSRSKDAASRSTENVRSRSKEGAVKAPAERSRSRSRDAATRAAEGEDAKEKRSGRRPGRNGSRGRLKLPAPGEFDGNASIASMSSRRSSNLDDTDAIHRTPRRSGRNGSHGRLNLPAPEEFDENMSISSRRSSNLNDTDEIHRTPTKSRAIKPTSKNKIQSDSALSYQHNLDESYRVDPRGASSEKYNLNDKEDRIRELEMELERTRQEMAQLRTTSTSSSPRHAPGRSKSDRSPNQKTPSRVTPGRHKSAMGTGIRPPFSPPIAEEPRHHGQRSPDRRAPRPTSSASSASSEEKPHRRSRNVHQERHSPPRIQRRPRSGSSR